MKRFSRSFLSGFCFSIFGIGGFLTGTLLVPPVLIFCSKRLQKRILSSTIHHLWRFFVWLMCCLKLIDIKIKNKQELKKLRGKIREGKYVFPFAYDNPARVGYLSRLPCR